jgi:hypothetical protein
MSGAGRSISTDVPDATGLTVAIVAGSWQVPGASSPKQVRA